MLKYNKLQQFKSYYLCKHQQEKSTFSDLDACLLVFSQPQTKILSFNQ